MSDYDGRRIDLLVFHGDNPGVPLAMSLNGNTVHGLVISGIRKLIQRFFLELFTVQGSLRGLPNRGCSFISDGWTGLWTTHTDIMGSFSAAVVSIKSNLLADQYDDDPLDEQLADV